MMTSRYFSQKNLCAFLGVVMALTIVWKAKEAQRLLAKNSLELESTERAYSYNGDSELFRLYLREAMLY